MNDIIFNMLFRLIRHDACVAFKKHLFNMGNVSVCQHNVLMEKLKRSRHSDFGKKYRFAEINSVQQFRDTVPVNKYQDLKPYIDRVVAGDVSALFNPGEKIVMFALTSGTTESSKYVPVTKQFLKEYKRGSFQWGYQMAVDHPDMLSRKILAIVSPYDEEYTQTGIPCGAISGMVAATQKYLARMLYILPYWVYCIPDQHAKYYTLLRLAMAEPQVGLITTANPSTLVKIARFADKYKENLIRDINDGTFSFSDKLPQDKLKKINPRLVKNPSRAKELELVAGEHANFYPKHFWPNIPLLATWKGGVLSHYIDILPEFYGDVPIRDLGLIASEGRMSVPSEDEGCSGVIDLESHFFEFIPEDEYGSGNPRTLLCHELERGRNYYIVLTTSAGYFRYDIHDLVTVTGFFEEAPCIAFLNKGKHISSLTGEKVSEYQVIHAIRTAMKSVDAHIHYFTVSPCWDVIPYYAVCLEENEELRGVNIEDFKKVFDEDLKQRNCEYLAKRQTGRLGSPKIFLIKKGTFDRLQYQKFERLSGRTEQYKHVYLNPEVDYHKKFEILATV